MGNKSKPKLWQRIPAVPLLMRTITAVMVVIGVCPAAVESSDFVGRRVFCDPPGPLQARAAKGRAGGRRDVAGPALSPAVGRWPRRTEGAALPGRVAAVKHSQENINTSNRRLAELLSFSIPFLLKNAMELFVLLRRKKLKIRL